MPFVGDLATGVASSLIFEALKRPFSVIQAELLKRKNISRPLNDRNSQTTSLHDKRVESIVNDLARVIGNKEGKLTHSVADFLSELQRTAIPETVAHAALCGSDPSALAPAFIAFAERFPDLPFTGEQLLNALYIASKLRVEAVNDPSMLEIIRSQHGELSNTLQQVSQALENILRHDRPLSLPALKEARLKVARAIEAANRHVTVETLKGSRKFNLKKLAIPGRLMLLDASHIQSAKAPHDGQTSSYLTFRRSLSRAVILGDPGGGKSTLTQLMSFDLSKIIGLNAGNQDQRYLDAFDLKLPIRIVLRSYEARQLKTPSIIS